MLEDLPPEILEQILGHLPTLSSILSFAGTSKKTRAVFLSNDGHLFFRGFVKNYFPSIAIGSTPHWRETAYALTSRSRAWDRRAFVAQEIAPPIDHASNWDHRVATYPQIDSYETHSAGSSDGKEVVAYSSAGRFRLRSTERRKGILQESWRYYAVEDDHTARMDIMDLRLLRPHQMQESNGESAVLRRAEGSIELVHCAGTEQFECQTRFRVPHEHVTECMAVSYDERPIIAVFDTETICLASLYGNEEHGTSFVKHKIDRQYQHRFRMRSSKFWTDRRLAASFQYVAGRSQAPIEVFELAEDRVSGTSLETTDKLSMHPNQSNGEPGGRHSAICLAPVDSTASLYGGSNLLLSGWTDGQIRLHDIRSGPACVRRYVDTVDSSQVASLLSVGQERFMAGTNDNALLKIFDMRMDNSPYSYLDSRPTGIQKPEASYDDLGTRKARDVNIFLAVRLPGWRTNPRLPSSDVKSYHSLSRYRGSVCSLSSPSATSSKIYAGIHDHVIRLDFASTDDLRANRCGLAEDVQSNPHPVLNLACYERPKKFMTVSNVPIILRNQTELKLEATSEDCSTSADFWDERWSLEPSIPVRTRGGRRNSRTMHRSSQNRS